MVETGSEKGTAGALFGSKSHGLTPTRGNDSGSRGRDPSANCILRDESEVRQIAFASLSSPTFDRYA